MTVSLVEACDDGQLLGSFSPWPRQRELLAALDSGPRLHVWALGRRSGKTTLAAVAALHNLLLRPDLDAMVRPGERRHAVCVATSIRQARVLLKAAFSVIEASPVLSGLVEGVSEDEIRFAGNRVLSALPCSSRSTRGWAVSFLVLDEAAHMHTESEGPAAAERVFESLVPSTAQFGSAARIVVSSTPAGSAGMFARLYAQAEAGELPDAAAHRASTREVNPTITQEFLDSEQARDPISFSSEYEARFVGGASAFFDEDLLEACVVRDDELDPREATEWVAGLDPGIWRDPFGLAIVGRDRNDSSRLLLGVARGWTPPKVKPDHASDRRDLEARVLGEVGDVLSRYGVVRAVSDGFMGAAVDEALHSRGIYPERVTLTGASRLEVFAALRTAMHGGRLALYRHDGLLAELARVRTSYRSGQLQVETPRSATGHFDLAIALALAVWTLDRDGPAGRGFPVLIDVSQPHPVFGMAEARPGRETTTHDLVRRVF